MYTTAINIHYQMFSLSIYIYIFNNKSKYSNFLFNCRLLLDTSFIIFKVILDGNNKKKQIMEMNVYIIIYICIVY